MRYLLDTQIFIWWDSEPERLPARLLELCEVSRNSLVLSVASLWEIQIKAQLGKLDLNRPLSTILIEQRRNNSLQVLPIEADHILALQELPLHHKDPFDRLIIAQARVENLVLLSVDGGLAQYPVTIIRG